MSEVGGQLVPVTPPLWRDQSHLDSQRLSSGRERNHSHPLRADSSQEMLASLSLDEDRHIGPYPGIGKVVCELNDAVVNLVGGHPRRELFSQTTDHRGPCRVQRDAPSPTA